MENYIFSYIESEKDLEDYFQLLRTVFGENDGVDTMVKRLLKTHPEFSPKNILLLKHLGKIVATLNIIPQTWIIEGAPLRAAEMGMVATLPEYRKKGLQRILNKEYDKIVSDEQYDISVIEGIPYFYRQFGYEYTIPLDVQTRLPINNMPDYEGGRKIRPMKESDLPRAAELLREAQRKYIVHSLRNEDVWAMQWRNRWQSDWPIEDYVVENAKAIAAYFRISKRDKTLIVVEVSETNQATFESIIIFLKNYAQSHGLTELVSRASQVEPFTKILQSIGAELEKPYAWQVKIINQHQVFEKLKPVFECRLANSVHRGLTDRLKINLYRNCMTLNFVEGKLIEVTPCEGLRGDEIRVNHEVFSQLLFASRSVEELCNIYPDVSVTQKYRSLVGVLFPKGPSFIHPCY